MTTSLINPDLTVNEKLIPEHMARRLKCVPLHREGNLLTIAMAQPYSEQAVENLEFLTKLKLKVIPADISSIGRALNYLYSADSEIDEDDGETLCGGSPEAYGLPADYEETIGKICNGILEDAIDEQAEKIEIDCFENKNVIVKYFINDSWIQAHTYKSITVPWILASFGRAIMSLNIAEAIEDAKLDEKKAIELKKDVTAVINRMQYANYFTERHSQKFNFQIKRIEKNGGSTISIQIIKL